MTLEYTVDNHHVRFEEAHTPDTEWIRAFGQEPWIGYVDGVEVAVVIQRPNEKAAQDLVMVSLMEIVEIPEDID